VTGPADDAVTTPAAAAAAPPKLAAHALGLLARHGDPIHVASIAANLGFVLRTWIGMAALTIGGNVIASIVVGSMLLGINTNLTGHQIKVSITVATIYVIAAAVIGTTIGSIIQRRTLRWLLRGEAPSEEDAIRAIRMPRDMAFISVALWAIGALVMAVTESAVSVPVRAIVEEVGGIVLGGLIAAGFTYLLIGRVTQSVSRLALATWPPRTAPLFGLGWRLMLVWVLTSGTPLVGILLILTAPGERTRIISTAVTAGVLTLGGGAFATFLTARSIGAPLRHLVGVLDQVGDGDLDVSVPVEDAGEIGLVQNVVNEMVEGLRERDLVKDMFGRHVGRAVAQEALRSGVTLSGELRDVVAVFVDITGSTAMTSTTNPGEFVEKLNRFLQIVVEEVESHGGLVNKFAGDAALAIFGAPMKLIDPATSGLRAARRIRDRVFTMGEVEVGVGVAYGPVVAGQVGTADRLEYTVIGDAVNEASRLTDLARTVREHLLASGAVIAHASENEVKDWNRSGEVVLRGRDVPTELWTA